jgi:hypothetical protein
MKAMSHALRDVKRVPTPPSARLQDIGRKSVNRGRRSMMASQIAPRVQRMSLTSPNGAPASACLEESVDDDYARRCIERAASSNPFARIHRRHHVRAKNPRSSSRRSISLLCRHRPMPWAQKITDKPSPRGIGTTKRPPTPDSGELNPLSRFSDSTEGSARSRACLHNCSGEKIGMWVPEGIFPCLCGLRSTVKSTKSVLIPQ